MPIGVHGDEIPSSIEFERLREADIAGMGKDESLRVRALDLQEDAERFRYTYQQKWCGVPVIRLPDDIVAFQELVNLVRPAFIAETGVARGGSLVMSASFMEMAGTEAWVLGIDIQIFDHAREAVSNCRWADVISLVECDSTSATSIEALQRFIDDAPGTGPGVLVLDSNHTHAHVLAELRALAPQLPLGSFILVADTLIEERGVNAFANRPWGPGNSPLSAVNQFLAEDRRFVRSHQWSRRGLLTEFRDGILERVDELN